MILAIVCLRRDNALGSGKYDVDFLEYDDFCDVLLYVIYTCVNY